jgi:hypothetical protein
MSKLYILCDHGLGNRLGGLISGLKAAQILNAKPIIAWPIDNWCQAEFNELFETGMDLADPAFSLSLVDQIQKQSMPYFFVAPIQDDMYMPTYYEHSVDALNAVSGHNKIVYSAAKIPKSYVHKHHVTEIISNLKINSNILKEVFSFCNKNKIDRSTVGLHIRKTDTGSLADEDEIYRYVMSNRSQRFFLCSDNPETEKRFLQIGNVIVYNKSSQVQKLQDGEWRDSVTDETGRKYLFNVNRPKQQIIEAFVDMLILSRTTINRQSKSTFCNMAERFSMIEIFNDKKIYS